MILTLFRLLRETVCTKRASGLAIALGMLAAYTPAKAQNPFKVTEGNIQAQVSPGGDGLITIYYLSTSTGTWLPCTFGGHSYLYVFVDGKYYSNQTAGLGTGINASTLQNNVPLIPLAGGTTFYTGPSKDTIETTWQPDGPNSFDIIQDVYPVISKYSGFGQIVYKWSVRNHQGTSLPVQAQFLLDDEMAGGLPSPDDSKWTTRDGYSANAAQDIWHNFTTIPPYFIATQNDIQVKGFPGDVAIGFTNDSFASVPLGLSQFPLSEMAIVDWPQYVTTYMWGYPQSYNGTPMSDNDNAMLFQWQPNSVAGSTTQPVVEEIGRGCYGIPPCSVCFGNLDALILHPDHIVWNAANSTYIPSSFPVEAVIWNPNQSGSARAAKGTQTITDQAGQKTGPLHIVVPPPSGSVYSETHPVTSGGSPRPDSIIQSLGASYINWKDTVISGVLTNCSTEIQYNIALGLAASGVNPGFVSACVCPIWVDCQEKDVTPPSFSKHHGSSVDSCGNFAVYTDTVFDSLQTDQGIQSITFTENPAGSVKVTIPTFSNCPHFVGPITLQQTSKLFNEVVVFTATDCAGNTSFDTVRFTKCVPPVPFDTLPPHFRPLSKYDWIDSNTSCGFRCSDWIVTDTVKNGLQQDKGLSSITVVSSTNMTYTPGPPVTPGMPKDSFTVCVNDTMQDGQTIIEAKDNATPPNISYDTINFCTVPDTAKPHSSISTLLPGLQYNVTAWDDSAWDRGLKQVLITSILGEPFNCRPIGNANVKLDSLNDTTWIVTPAVDSCPATISFYVAVVDSFGNACFAEQAMDCAGNVSAQKRQCYTALSDTYCPKIDTATLPNGELSVTIYDIHTGGPDTIGYDEGIDSIWFTCAHNMSLVLDSGATDANGSIFQSQGNSLHTLYGQPTGGDHPRYSKIIRFKLFVTDTNSQDGISPCVCINAVDGAANELCGGTYSWCSSVAQDRFPPELSMASNCETIGVVVTDSTQYDRGVDRIWLDSITNFAPINDSSFSGQKVVPLTLRVPDSNKSSYAVLSSVDVFGVGSPVPGVAAQHTTTSDVWIYKQDLRMYGSGIANANTNFSVPVILTPTDSIPLAQKNLTQFAFTFHLTGSPLVTYTGFTLSQALQMAGWTPGAASAMPPYVISATGPKLTNAESKDTLAILHFTALASNDVEEAQIQIDPDPCGAGVVYNGGNDTVLTGMSFTASLPAPSGRLNGGTIILKDSCGTIVGINPHPVYLSIAPVVPNPVANIAVVSYTVPAEAPVSLELYDELGRKVRTLLAQTEKQGTYQIEIQTAGLAAGMYHLLLTSQGQEASQWVMIP